MKGVFAVKEVVDRGNLGLGLRGMVISGQLIPGMEARSGYSIIIINQLLDESKGQEIVKQRVRKGQMVIVQPLQLVFEVLKATEGTELLFEELRSETIKKGLVLETDLV